MMDTDTDLEARIATLEAALAETTRQLHYWKKLAKAASLQPISDAMRKVLIQLAEQHVGIWVKESVPALKLIPTAARQDIRDFVDAVIAALSAPTPTNSMKDETDTQ